MYYLLVFVLLAKSANCYSVLSQFQYSNISQNVKIIGGENISISDTPYQVSIRNRYNNHFCGGAIIDGYNVLTAAHCLESHQKEKLYCAVGTNAINQGILYPIKSVSICPDYNSETVENDIAILHLAKKLDINNKTTKAISLTIEAPVANTSCKISGWGSISEPEIPEFATPSFNLRAGIVPIVSKQECLSDYLSKLNITVKQIGILCAGYKDGHEDSCQGDSGGPLVCNGNLSGIVSWGYGCGKPGIPGIYTDVAVYRDWVLNNLSKSGAKKYNTVCLLTIFFSFLGSFIVLID